MFAVNIYLPHTMHPGRQTMSNIGPEDTVPYEEKQKLSKRTETVLKKFHSIK